eukprot:Opistho-2@84191
MAVSATGRMASSRTRTSKNGRELIMIVPSQSMSSIRAGFVLGFTRIRKGLATAIVLVPHNSVVTSSRGMPSGSDSAGTHMRILLMLRHERSRSTLCDAGSNVTMPLWRLFGRPNVTFCTAVSARTSFLSLFPYSSTACTSKSGMTSRFSATTTGPPFEGANLKRGPANTGAFPFHNSGACSTPGRVNEAVNSYFTLFAERPLSGIFPDSLNTSGMTSESFVQEPDRSTGTVVLAVAPSATSSVAFGKSLRSSDTLAVHWVRSTLDGGTTRSNLSINCTVTLTGTPTRMSSTANRHFVASSSFSVMRSSAAIALYVILNVIAPSTCMSGSLHMPFCIARSLLFDPAPSNFSFLPMVSSRASPLASSTKRTSTPLNFSWRGSLSLQRFFTLSSATMPLGRWKRIEREIIVNGTARDATDLASVPPDSFLRLTLNVKVPFAP